MTDEIFIPVKVEERLAELYNKMVSEEETSSDIDKHEDDIKILFSKNLQFLRMYLGFWAVGEPYTRTEFASMLNVSVPTLKNWELGYSLPNHYSLKRIISVVKKVLNVELRPEQLYCKSISHIISALQLGMDEVSYKTISEGVEKVGANEMLNIILNRSVEYHDIFHILVEHAPIGVYMFQDYRLMFVNPAMANGLGYQPEELIGKSIMELIHPDDTALVNRMIQERLVGRMEFVEYTLRLLSKDGHIRYWRVKGSVTLYKDKPAIIGTAVDFGHFITSSSLFEGCMNRNPLSLRPFINEASQATVVMRCVGTRANKCEDFVISVFNDKADAFLRQFGIVLQPGIRVSQLLINHPDVVRELCNIYCNDKYRVYRRLKLKAPNETIVNTRFRVIRFPLTEYIVVQFEI